MIVNFKKYILSITFIIISLHLSIVNLANPKEGVLPASFVHSLDTENLTYYIIPHTHTDAGWYLTFSGYYNSKVKKILSTTVSYLNDTYDKLEQRLQNEGKSIHHNGGSSNNGDKGNGNSGKTNEDTSSNGSGNSNDNSDNSNAVLVWNGTAFVWQNVSMNPGNNPKNPGSSEPIGTNNNNSNGNDNKAGPYRNFSMMNNVQRMVWADFAFFHKWWTTDADSTAKA
jgi:hypothetical protein